MRKFLLLNLVLILIASTMGCGSVVEETVEDAPLVEEVPVIDYTPVLDSLALEKDSLEAELEQLQINFEYKADDFEGRSWYHKKWKYNYYYYDHALLAGVDSLGTFFLLTNMRGGVDMLENEELRILFGGNTYIAKTDTAMPDFESHQMLLCACAWEILMYSGADAEALGKLVSENVKTPMRMVFTGKRKRSFDLGKRDRTGIRDTYLLSLAVQKLRILEEEIDRVQQLAAD